MKSLIQKLVETPGPSGFEYKIRDAVREEIGDYSRFRSEWMPWAA